MSDFLSSVLGVFPAVQLGPFAFYAFEVPQRMRWGGEHAGALHKLIGGARVLDKTGPDDGPIEWSGILLGENAKDRARQLNALRENGGPFDLDWAGSSQRVWLKSCRFDEGFSQIGYQIACETLPPAPRAVSRLAPAREASDLFRADGALQSISTALADVQRSPLFGVVGSVTAALSAVGVKGASAIGSTINATALGAIGAASTAVNAAHGVASATLAAATDISLGTPGGFLAALGAARDAAVHVGAAAQLVRASDFLGRR